MESTSAMTRPKHSQSKDKAQEFFQYMLRTCPNIGLKFSTRSRKPTFSVLKLRRHYNLGRVNWKRNQKNRMQDAKTKNGIAISY